MTRQQRAVPVPVEPAHCVLPDLAGGAVLAPLPAYGRFPWDPLVPAGGAIRKRG